MANMVTNRGKYEVFTLDVAAQDLRVLLLKTYSVLDIDDNVIDDLVPGTNEVSVGGYSRQTLAGETITEDDSANVAYLDATDPVFTSLVTGETVQGAILFRHTGSDATAPVWAGYDLTDTPTNGGNITVQFQAPASGGALQGA